MVIAGFGNPLLDISVVINDNTLLEKYGFKEDRQCEVTVETMNLLLEDISKYSIAYNPGGCAQNTLRVYQWIVQQPNASVMFGSVGTDRNGEILEKLVRNDGVQTRYIKIENKSTGNTVALIRGTNRTLVAYIGAAEMFKFNDKLKNEMTSLLKNVEIVYIEGFFLTGRTTPVKYIQEMCISNKNTLAFNLNGVYCFDVEQENMIDFALKCDILFGNKDEFTELNKRMDIGLKTVENLAVHLVKSYEHKKSMYRKLVVITNGSEPVVCAYSNGGLERINVPRLESSKVVDTTGAGDSFVAGFFAGLSTGHDPVTCVEWGNFAAQEIIQRVGVAIPTHAAQFCV